MFGFFARGFGLAWLPPLPREGGGKQKYGGQVDAEHVTEGAEDSSGLGDGGEEFGHVGAGEEVFELAGAAADVVVGAACEPGVAGGEVGFRARGVRLSGVRGPRGGQGVGLPAGEEALETDGGAGDAIVGKAEYGCFGAVDVRAKGQSHSFQDGGEQRCECFHS